jgi:hypothetical protein
MEEDGVTLLGDTMRKGQNVRFGIKDADRLFDVALLGKAKERIQFMTTLALQDAARGTGVLLIDLTGELSEFFTERLDMSARKRLIYLDPSDAEYPFSWNPLEDYRALGEDAAPRLTRLLTSLYRSKESPLFAFLAAWMLDRNDATLLSAYELVAEAPLRDKLMPKDDAHRAELDSLMNSETEAAEAIRGNGRYLAKDTLVRNLLGQSASKFNIAELDDGAIIVLDLSRIRMFPTRIAPLARLFSHAARATLETPAAVYWNECLRTFSQADVDHILTDRVLAVTFSESLLSPEDPVRKTALARAGTVVAFSPNANDLALTESLFFPYISASDIEKLEEGEMTLMLTIDSVRSRPFFARAAVPPPRQNVSYQDVQVASRAEYATSRHAVDQGFIKKYAPPPAPKPGDTGSFSNAFRSIFAKGAAGGATPPPAPGAASPLPKSPAQASASKQEPKADVNKKPAEISEEELKKMLYVTPIE